MSDKFFKYWFAFVAALAVLMIVSTIAFTIVVGKAAYDVSSEVNSKGAKAVIDRLWCGEKGCQQ